MWYQIFLFFFFFLFLFLKIVSSVSHCISNAGGAEDTFCGSKGWLVALADRENSSITLEIEKEIRVKFRASDYAEEASSGGSFSLSACVGVQ